MVLDMLDACLHAGAARLAKPGESSASGPFHDKLDLAQPKRC